MKKKSKKCFFQKKGVPLYRDQVHLTYAGSEYINNKILQILKQIDLDK